MPALIFIRVPFSILASLLWLREGCTPSRSLDRLLLLLPMQFPAVRRFILERQAREENVLAPHSAVLHCPASVFPSHSVAHRVPSLTGFSPGELVHPIHCFPCPKSISTHSQLWISIQNKASRFQAIFTDSRTKKATPQYCSYRTLTAPAHFTSQGNTAWSNLLRISRCNKQAGLVYFDWEQR